MDWKSINFDWNRAKAFLVTAEVGSFTAAAASLGLSQPTLSRQVSALETELGVALFEHEGRGIVLTPSGVALAEHVRAMGEAAMQLSIAATGRSQCIEGSVCITTSEIAAAYILPAIIQKLRRKAPKVRIELIASNSTTDLRRREADIAVRFFRPTHPDLIVKKVAEITGRLYASEAYLADIGNPKKLQELDQAEYIEFSESDTITQSLKSIGLNPRASQFPIMTESRVVHWELAKTGLGIAAMPEIIGDNEPLVKRVLPSLMLGRGEVWLASHRELKTSRRVRLVFGFLADELARALAPDQQ